MMINRLQCVSLLISVIFSSALFAEMQNFHHWQAPFFSRQMDFDYFQKNRTANDFRTKLGDEYDVLNLIYELIMKMENLSEEEVNITSIRPLMKSILKLNGDQYFMFFQFMKNKNMTPHARIWMNEFVMQKLTKHTAEGYANQIFVDYLRRMSCFNIEEMDKKEQLEIQMTLMGIFTFEAENNSVLTLLKKDELKKICAVTKKIFDPMGNNLYIFLEVYEQKSNNIEPDLKKLFKKYHPGMPYPTSRESVSSTSFGFRLAVYNILLHNKTQSSEINIWYKYLYNGGYFFRKFIFYHYAK